MHKQNIIKIFLVIGVLVTLASICPSSNGNGSNAGEATDTYAPPNPGPPVVVAVTDEVPLPTQPPPLSPHDRCTYFENKEVKFIFHTMVEGDDSMTMYVYMEGGWPGNELMMPGDPGPYEFNATFGNLESIHCNFLEYENRLYCTFPLTKSYYNTAQVFKLFVNGCSIPVVEHQYLSIIVETKPPVPQPPPPPPTSCCMCVHTC